MSIFSFVVFSRLEVKEEEGGDDGDEAEKQIQIYTIRLWFRTQHKVEYVYRWVDVRIFIMMST